MESTSTTTNQETEDFLLLVPTDVFYQVICRYLHDHNLVALSATCKRYNQSVDTSLLRPSLSMIISDNSPSIFHHYCKALFNKHRRCANITHRSSVNYCESCFDTITLATAIFGADKLMVWLYSKIEELMLELPYGSCLYKYKCDGMAIIAASNSHLVYLKTIDKIFPSIDYSYIVDHGSFLSSIPVAEWLIQNEKVAIQRILTRSIELRLNIVAKWIINRYYHPHHSEVFITVLVYGNFKILKHLYKTGRFFDAEKCMTYSLKNGWTHIVEWLHTKKIIDSELIVNSPYLNTLDSIKWAYNKGMVDSDSIIRTALTESRINVLKWALDENMEFGSHRTQLQEQAKNGNHILKKWIKQSGLLQITR